LVRDTGRALDSRRIRRLSVPNRIEVQTDARGIPMRVSTDGVWQEVTLTRRPWRIDQHWWRTDLIRRDYFRLALESGPPMTVYHDLVGDSWAQQEY
jgi:hypothetical protein